MNKAILGVGCPGKSKHIKGRFVRNNFLLRMRPVSLKTPIVQTRPMRTLSHSTIHFSKLLQYRRLVHCRDIGGVDCVRASAQLAARAAAAALAVGRWRVVGSERTLVQPTLHLPTTTNPEGDGSSQQPSQPRPPPPPPPAGHPPRCKTL